MPFNVQEFRSALRYDGARPNLFKCDLTFPTFATARSGGLGGAADRLGLSEKFSFMCRASSLPGSTVNQVPMMYFGRELKFSGNRTFPEWSVTIINDEDFSLRDAFEKWMHALNSHVTNRRSNVAINNADYQADGFITQYAKNQDITREKRYKFVGLFPIDVSPIEVDWGANDTIEEFAVTFAYQWWESEGTTELTFTSD
jgi:hypothetical protein